MSETKRIQDQLRRAHEGEAWHGPAVKELLAGVTAAQAARRPIADAHSVWELVLHIEAWMRAATQSLTAGQPMPKLPWEGDWRAVNDTSEAGWTAALAALDRTVRELLDAVGSFPETRLKEKVPGREYSYGFLLDGVVQHNLYHAGQMALLKKA